MSRRPSERVLLIGNYGNGNIGDDAILTRMAPRFLASGLVTVLSRRPERIAALVPDVHPVPMVSFPAVAAFARSDTVVIGGGGMFGRGLPPMVALLPFVLLAAQALGKDVELRSLGAYPDMPGSVAWALRRVARRARHVSARDEASVRTLGGPGLVTLVRDPAWELEPASDRDVDAALAAAGVDTGADGPIIGVSLKPGAGAESDRHCLAAVAKGLDRWSQQGGGRILYLCFSDKGDYQLGAALTDADMGRELQESMSDGSSVRFVEYGLPPDVMLGIVRRCSGVVALRLHAQIFARVVDRPLYGLSFEPKCDEFLASVGMTPVRPDQLSADDLCDWLARVAPLDRTS